MGARRPRAIGEFSWYDADLGVECRTCGRVAVYCDWEAQACFRERGWSTAIDDALPRFRCRCGSREVRFHAVPIGVRPKPIPQRPAALRPIYADDARALRRRGPTVPPDAQAVEAALDVLRDALRRRDGNDVRGPALDEALAVLRPHCYRKEDVDGFADAVAPTRDQLFGGQSARQAFTGILRQLGRTPE